MGPQNSLETGEECLRRMTARTTKDGGNSARLSELSEARVVDMRCLVLESIPSADRPDGKRW